MRRSRSEFAITEADGKLIAAAASIVNSSMPNIGYNAPAAIDIPTPL